MTQPNIIKRWLIAAIAVFLIGAMPSAHAAVRVALIIGNSNYAHVVRLDRSVKDAETLGTALRGVGFTTVEIKKDLGANAMREALQAFAQLASNADVAVIYYAGHGMELSGMNYLIPVDATLEKTGDLDFEAIPLGLMQHAVSGARQLKLVILDACHDNPFAANMKGEGTRGMSRGLARLEPNGTNALVAFAAKDGTVAEDVQGAGSPFVEALVKEISIPGVEVRLLFGRVRDAVLAATHNKQEPFTYGSLGGDAVYFTPPPSGGAGKEMDRPATHVDSQAMEVAFWNSVANSGDAIQLQGYLERYPAGAFAGAARAKIRELQKSAAPPPKPKASTIDSKTLELELWKSVSSTNDEAQLKAYIEKFPNGTFASVARAKIAALKRGTSQVAPPQAQPTGPTIDPTIAADVQAAVADAREKSESAKLAQFKGQKAAEFALSAAKRAQEDAEPVDVGDGSSDFVNAMGGIAALAKAFSNYTVNTGTNNQGVTWRYAGSTKDRKWDGNGIIVWGNGERYQGELKAGARSGYGIYTFSDGKRYEGQFANGDPNGVGVEYFLNGDRFEGEFVGGVWTGSGCYYFKSGQVWVGTWKNRTLEGFGSKLDANGNQTELGLFVAGKLTRISG